MSGLGDRDGKEGSSRCNGVGQAVGFGCHGGRSAVPESRRRVALVGRWSPVRECLFLLFCPRGRASGGTVGVTAVLGGGCGPLLGAESAAPLGLVVSCVSMQVVASSAPLWWSALVAASVSPDVGSPPAAGRRWACWLACWCVRATVSGFARGAFGDLGVSFVASALPVGGVCRVVS